MDCEIRAGDLLTLIARSLFAAADEHSRYAINGVLLDRKGTEIRMIATDGRRLAMAIGSVASGDGDTNCIVPSKALGIMRRLLRSDDDATVRLAIDEHRIHVHVDDGSGQATLSSSLVESRFPPFEDVIPKDQDKKVVFNCDSLRAAVRQAALLTSEESRSVRMCFQNKQLVLTSAPEMGEAEVHIDLPDYAGEDLEIGFNPTYLSDALKVIDQDQIIFELKASNKPGVLRTGKEFTYVLMPVNLS